MASDRLDKLKSVYQRLRQVIAAADKGKSKEQLELSEELSVEREALQAFLAEACSEFLTEDEEKALATLRSAVEGGESIKGTCPVQKAVLKTAMAPTAKLIQRLIQANKDAASGSGSKEAAPSPGPKTPESSSKAGLVRLDSFASPVSDPKSEPTVQPSPEAPAKGSPAISVTDDASEASGPSSPKGRDKPDEETFATLSPSPTKNPSLQASPSEAQSLPPGFVPAAQERINQMRARLEAKRKQAAKASMAERKVAPAAGLAAMRRSQQVAAAKAAAAAASAKEPTVAATDPAAIAAASAEESTVVPTTAAADFQTSSAEEPAFAATTAAVDSQAAGTSVKDSAADASEASVLAAATTATDTAEEPTVADVFVVATEPASAEARPSSSQSTADPDHDPTPTTIATTTATAAATTTATPTTTTTTAAAAAATTKTTNAEATSAAVDLPTPVLTEAFPAEVAVSEETEAQAAPTTDAEVVTEVPTPDVVGPTPEELAAAEEKLAEEKAAAEAKAAEEKAIAEAAERKLAEEKATAEAAERKAAEEKAAAEAEERRLAEEKAAAEAEERRLAEEKAAAEAKHAEAVKAAEEKLAEEKAAAEAKAAEEKAIAEAAERKLAEEKTAAEAAERKAAEEKAAAEAEERRLAEEKAAAEAEERRLAEEKAAAEAKHAEAVKAGKEELLLKVLNDSKAQEDTLRNESYRLAGEAVGHAGHAATLREATASSLQKLAGLKVTNEANEQLKDALLAQEPREKSRLDAHCIVFRSILGRDAEDATLAKADEKRLRESLNSAEELLNELENRFLHTQDEGEVLLLDRNNVLEESRVEVEQTKNALKEANGSGVKARVAYEGRMAMLVAQAQKRGPVPVGDLEDALDVATRYRQELLREIEQERRNLAHLSAKAVDLRTTSHNIADSFGGARRLVDRAPALKKELLAAEKELFRVATEVSADHNKASTLTIDLARQRLSELVQEIEALRRQEEKQHQWRDDIKLRLMFPSGSSPQQQIDPRKPAEQPSQAACNWRKRLNPDVNAKQMLFEAQFPGPDAPRGPKQARKQTPLASLRTTLENLEKQAATLQRRSNAEMEEAKAKSSSGQMLRTASTISATGGALTHEMRSLSSSSRTPGPFQPFTVVTAAISEDVAKKPSRPEALEALEKALEDAELQVESKRTAFSSAASAVAAAAEERLALTTAEAEVAALEACLGSAKQIEKGIQKDSTHRDRPSARELPRRLLEEEQKRLEKLRILASSGDSKPTAATCWKRAAAAEASLERLTLLKTSREAAADRAAISAEDMIAKVLDLSTQACDREAAEQQQKSEEAACQQLRDQIAYRKAEVEEEKSELEELRKLAESKSWESRARKLELSKANEKNKQLQAGLKQAHELQKNIEAVEHERSALLEVASQLEKAFEEKNAVAQQTLSGKQQELAKMEEEHKLLLQELQEAEEDHPKKIKDAQDIWQKNRRKQDLNLRQKQAAEKSSQEEHQAAIKDVQLAIRNIRKVEAEVEAQWREKKSEAMAEIQKREKWIENRNEIPCTKLPAPIASDEPKAQTETEGKEEAATAEAAPTAASAGAASAATAPGAKADTEVEEAATAATPAEGSANAEGKETAAAAAGSEVQEDTEAVDLIAEAAAAAERAEATPTADANAQPAKTEGTAPTSEAAVAAAATKPPEAAATTPPEATASASATTTTTPPPAEEEAGTEGSKEERHQAEGTKTDEQKQKEHEDTEASAATSAAEQTEHTEQQQQQQQATAISAAAEKNGDQAEGANAAEAATTTEAAATTPGAQAEEAAEGEAVEEQYGEPSTPTPPQPEALAAETPSNSTTANPEAHAELVEEKEEEQQQQEQEQQQQQQTEEANPTAPAADATPAPTSEDGVLVGEEEDIEHPEKRRRTGSPQTSAGEADVESEEKARNGEDGAAPVTPADREDAAAEPSAGIIRPPDEDVGGPEKKMRTDELVFFGDDLEQILADAERAAAAIVSGLQDPPPTSGDAAAATSSSASASAAFGAAAGDGVPADSSAATAAAAAAPTSGGLAPESGDAAATADSIEVEEEAARAET